MSSFNKVILIGNISIEPKLNHTSSGVSACSFSIAVNRPFVKPDSGQQSVDFFNVISWRSIAEFVVKYFKKGSPILVAGHLQTRSWSDNQGNTRYVTEVVADEVTFVGSKSFSSEASADNPDGGSEELDSVDDP